MATDKVEFMIRLKPELKDEVSEIAGKLDISMSKVGERAVYHYVDYLKGKLACGETKDSIFLKEPEHLYQVREIMIRSQNDIAEIKKKIRKIEMNMENDKYEDISK
jgi:hypothetical protein